MTTIAITPDRLTIHLTRFEKVFGALRNQQALSLTLAGHKFQRVLVGTDNAQSYVDQLRALGVS